MNGNTSWQAEYRVCMWEITLARIFYAYSRSANPPKTGLKDSGDRYRARQV